jgi:class I lanthipeptide synthase
MDSRSTQQAAPATPTAGAAWSPILSGDARAEALELVDVLAEGMRRERAALSGDASLSSGLAGLAVFYAQLARAGRGGSDDAVSIIDEAVDALAHSPMGVSLYSGFPGIAWANEFVSSTLELSAESGASEIDDALLRALQRREWSGAPYDLIYGLTGIGVYALSRWPRGTATDMLTCVAEHLADRASHDGDGAYWWTSPELLLGPRRMQSPGGAVDLGVAHGMGAVIPLLARIGRLGVDRERLTALSGDAARWLLTHAVEGELGPTVPAFLDDRSHAEPGPARSAWCYGDPGVAATLLLAARDNASPAWEGAAVRLAIRAARRPEGETGVRDTGFCHGSAGLAHLFNRMHQMTAEPVLADAARHWLERAMNDVRQAEGMIPGPSDGHAPPWNGPGLLEGMAGVALVLLAASSPAPPTWDSIFLVSSTLLGEAVPTPNA